MKMLLPIFILLFSASISAQVKLNTEIPTNKSSGVITGFVIDSSTGEGVEYASVSLYIVDESKIIEGSLTDNNGKFKIKNIANGKYIIHVDFIGYNKYSSSQFEVNNNKVKLGKINLQVSAEYLDNVVVTEERTYVENKIDKKVVNIGKDLLVAGASATEVMSKLPSIDVDIDGGISLRGNDNVRMLVDGRPTNLSSADLLAEIPAENIEKVEIITNPSAKYDPDGISGIINIILKKDKKLGFNGSASAGVGTAKDFSGIDKYNGSLNLNYNVGKLNLFANYGYRNQKRVSSGGFNREFYNSNNETKTLVQESDNGRKRFSNSLKAGASFNLSAKDYISYTANYKKSGKDSYSNVGYVNTLNATNTTGNLDYNSLSHDIVYKNDFDEGRVLELNVYRLDSEEDGANEFNTQNSSGKQPKEEDNTLGGDDLTTFQADYSVDNTEYKIEVGAKGSLRNINSDYKYLDDKNGELVYDENRSDIFDYNEQIYSAYTNYERKFDKWSMQAGLRLEQSLIESKLVGDTVYENDYFNFYPSLFLKRKIGGEGNEVGFSYSRRVSRPSTWKLNPAKRFNDTLNIRQGNPYLNPEFTNSFEVLFNKYFKEGSFNSSVFYRHTTDRIQRIKSVDDNSVSTMSYANISSADEVGAEASVMYKVAKWWSLNANFNVYYINYNFDNTAINKNGINWFVRLNNTFNITKSFSLQASGKYNGKRVIAQGYVDPMYSVDLGLRKSFFNKKASLSFRVSDVFNTYKLDYYTSGTGFKEEGMRRWESRVAYLTFNYKFGDAKKRKSGKPGVKSKGGDNTDVGL
ncbi:MAG: TonB-dependent receptor [Ichthyobacteriaceae bacterium]|nr:TonB-dependent receptor [Ichthyobacteriaceae bacterium]